MKVEEEINGIEVSCLVFDLNDEIFGISNSDVLVLQGSSVEQLD